MTEKEKLGKKAIDALTSTWRPAEERKLDLYDRLLQVDERLAAAGFPKLTKFWKSTLKSFLRSKKKRLVLRVGRRGGKSLTLCKLGVTVALYSETKATPGELIVVGYISVDRGEASNRVRMNAAMLDALGQSYERRGDEIELPARSRVLMVLTATVAGVSGRTADMIAVDEGAKMKDSITGLNSAREIIAGATPPLATTEPRGRDKPGGFLVFSGSPFGEGDHHAELFQKGDDDYQMVAHAPTWVANDSITEAQTKEMEPDPRLWSREYLAVPVASVTSIASKDEIDAVIAKGVRERPRVPGARYLGTMDPSSLRNDAWVVNAWALELRARRDGVIEEVLVQVGMERYAPTFLKRPTFDGCVGDSLAFFRKWGIREVRTDGHNEEAIRPRFAEAGVQLVAAKMSSPEISRRVETLMARIANGTIVLLDDEVQRRELETGQVEHHSNSRVTFRAPARRGMHDDTVSPILLAMDPDAVIKLPPCESDVVVRYGSVNYDFERGLQVGATKYYRRLPNGGLQQTEPPFGSEAFIEYAVRSVAAGMWTDGIRRWCAELGHEPRPDIDPAKLDPNARTKI